MRKLALPRIKTVRGPAILIIFALCGFLAITLSQAATPSASREAEQGILSGNYALTSGVNATGASGSSAVKFGGAGDNPLAAGNLKAFGGGDSIGITWNPVADPADPNKAPLVTGYNVFRDGVKIGSTTPDNNLKGLENGTIYVDKTAAKGKTYSYQVQPTSTKAAFQMSKATSASIPANTFPTPNFTMNSDASSYITAEQVTWLQNYFIPFIKDWYPKWGEQLARGGYTPLSTFNLKVMSQADYNNFGVGVGWCLADKGTIYVPPFTFEDPDWKLIANDVLFGCTADIFGDISGKEYTDYAPSWVLSGITQTMAHYIYKMHPYSEAQFEKDDVFFSVNYYYTDGSLLAAWFMDQIAKRYSVPYAHDANIARHNKTFGPANLVLSSGYNTDKAWSYIRQQPARIGEIKNVGTGKCLTTVEAKVLAGNRSAISTCNGSQQQQATFLENATTDSSHISIYSFYLAALLSNLTAGFYNNSGADQEWTYDNTSRTIRGIESGKCLQPDGTSSADDTTLSVATCDPTNPRQQWTIPAEKQY